MNKNRCPWSGTDPLYVAYHDEEWGVPVHDDRVLFEFLVLAGAQAGLTPPPMLAKAEAGEADAKEPHAPGEHTPACFAPGGT